MTRSNPAGAYSWLLLRRAVGKPIVQCARSQMGHAVFFFLMAASAASSIPVLSSFYRSTRSGGSSGGAPSGSGCTLVCNGSFDPKNDPTEASSGGSPSKERSIERGERCGGGSAETLRKTAKGPEVCLFIFGLVALLGGVM